MTATISFRQFILTAIFAFAAASTAAREPAVNAPTSQDAALDRMTSHLLTMLPMDRIFQQVMGEHREELNTQLDAKQLDCLQGEVSADAFRARKRADVQRFATAKPQDFESGLKVLDDGAAALIVNIMEASLSGKDYEMSGADPDDMVAFMSFVYASQHTDLRELSGFGDFSKPNASGAALESMMNSLAADIGKRCSIPAEFFK
jgi:hypothetical protein